MKNVILIFLAFITCQTFFAQAPNVMSYQAVVRDADNNLVSNQAVGLKVSVLTGSASGTVVYEETHNVNSNLNGLVSLIIGEGTNQIGSFAAIDWSVNTHFIKTEIDPNGGTNYTIVGVQQLLSVPYAMHANTADNLGGVEGSEIGEMLYWNGSSWITIPNGVDQDYLINCNGVPTWGFCRPELTTAIDGIVSATTASIRSQISSQPGITLNERGFCYNTSPNPTTSNFTKAENSSSFGTWTRGLADLTPNTTYYVRSYGIVNTSNGVETFYGNEISFTTSATLGPGDYYPEEGGVIFYVLQSGDPGYIANELHGLIVSINYDDTSPGYDFYFGCSGTLIGGTSQDLFTGQNNTNLILADCPSSDAANACNDFVSLGFDDWYLPSVSELSVLYQRIVNVNATLLNIDQGFKVFNIGHMSSSEMSATRYYTWNFGGTDLGNRNKNSAALVRVIRTF